MTAVAYDRQESEASQGFRRRASCSPIPQYAADVLLWGRIGNHWADLLRGRRDPVDLLFGDGGSDTVEHFYDTSPIAGMHNHLARSLVEAMVQSWPAGRPLRVLEVGAGTGGTTATLLPVLPPERTRYVFTDVSATFLTAAEARFETYGFVDYRLLDIDQDLQRTGLRRGDLRPDRRLATSCTWRETYGAPCGDSGAFCRRAARCWHASSTTREVVVGCGRVPRSVLVVHRQRSSARVGRCSPASSGRALFRECGFDEVVQCGAAQEPARSDFSVTLARRDRHPAGNVDIASRRAGRVVARSRWRTRPTSVSLRRWRARSPPPGRRR